MDKIRVNSEGEKKFKKGLSSFFPRKHRNESCNVIAPQPSPDFSFFTNSHGNTFMSFWF